MILCIYIIYIYIDHLLHVTKNVRKKKLGKIPKKKEMKVTTREHLLFCTTCLFSFYYRRRSLSSGMHKVGGGVSGVRRLPKCDTFMDRISFICETSFLLCVCCSSSHHSPLLLLCFFSLRVACFYCFALFFLDPPPQIARRPRCRINDFRQSTSAVTVGAFVSRPSWQTRSDLR